METPTCSECERPARMAVWTRRPTLRSSSRREAQDRLYSIVDWGDPSASASADASLYCKEHGLKLLAELGATLVQDDDEDPQREWTKAEMRDVRDHVVAISERHERESHDGEECLGNRVSIVAFLMHALGLSHAHLPTIGEALAGYEVEHLRHARENGGRAHGEHA